MFKYRNFQIWQVILVVALLALLLLGTAAPAFASDIRSGETVTIAQGEVIDDDLLLFATTIVVNGTVNGDLIAFGNSVTVNGTVNGSALLGAQTVNVGGQIKGTVYAGSAALNLAPTARIERNVMFGGYSLQAAPGSTIARDLWFGGAQAILRGKLGRDVNFAGEALELNGEIGRNVSAHVAEPNQTNSGAFYGPDMPPAIASGLRVARNAKISGSLTYFSPVDQANEILATPANGVVYQYQKPGEGVDQPQPVNFMNEWLFNRVRDFITVLIIGLLALWLIRPWMLSAVSHAQSKPLASAGWGLLVLIAGYVVALVLFVAIVLIGILFGVTTLGGLSLATFGVGAAGAAFFGGVFTAIVVWGTKVVVALLIGKLILGRFAPQYAENAFLAFLLGLVLFEIVAAIPFLGFVVTIVTILLGLGALWYVWYDRRKAQPLSLSNPTPMPA